MLPLGRAHKCPLLSLNSHLRELRIENFPKIMVYRMGTGAKNIPEIFVQESREVRENREI